MNWYVPQVHFFGKPQYISYEDLGWKLALPIKTSSQWWWLPGSQLGDGGPSWQDSEGRVLVQLCCIFLWPWAGHAAFQASSCIVCKLRAVILVPLVCAVSDHVMYPWCEFWAGFCPLPIHCFLRCQNLFWKWTKVEGKSRISFCLPVF